MGRGPQSLRADTGPLGGEGGSPFSACALGVQSCLAQLCLPAAWSLCTTLINTNQNCRFATLHAVMGSSIVTETLSAGERRVHVSCENSGPFASGSWGDR